jgi:hypothetical protein
MIFKKFHIPVESKNTLVTDYPEYMNLRDNPFIPVSFCDVVGKLLVEAGYNGRVAAYDFREDHYYIYAYEIKNASYRIDSGTGYELQTNTRLFGKELKKEAFIDLCFYKQDHFYTYESIYDSFSLKEISPSIDLTLADANRSIREDLDQTPLVKPDAVVVLDPAISPAIAYHIQEINKKELHWLSGECPGINDLIAPFDYSRSAYRNQATGYFLGGKTALPVQTFIVPLIPEILDSEYVKDIPVGELLPDINREDWKTGNRSFQQIQVSHVMDGWGNLIIKSKNTAGKEIILFNRKN